ncbi:MAG: dynamin family protein [Actinomycetota bacterium]
MSLADGARDLLEHARVAYQGHPAEAEVTALATRLNDPLRVAIAGKVKAGKSTLLNALVGERLAPTDASECTRVVTWYRDGVTYRVTLHPMQGEPIPAPFRREDGALDIDLGGRPHTDINEIEVEWPSASLRRMTLIDTPGIDSLSTDISARAEKFLAPEDDVPTAADAVLYLMRHLHAGDVRFLESFHDEEVAQATPINAIAVLSRADEIGVARLDAMASARRIAHRYRGQTKVRRLCQTVLPVAGLLAETAVTLNESEFRRLRQLAALDRDRIDELLLSVDRFVADYPDLEVLPIERSELLDRFGMFGVRLSIALLRQDKVTTASQLAIELAQRSGLNELRSVLSEQFSARADVLKARSVVVALEDLILRSPPAESEALDTALERFQASAHEFAEIRLLNAIRLGSVGFSAEEIEVAERLLGAGGNAVAHRLGVELEVGLDEQRALALELHQRWQRRGESPLSTRDVVEASRILSRTCEGILAGLAAVSR